MTKKNAIIDIAIYTENHIFPIIFIYFSLNHIHSLYNNIKQISYQFNTLNITKINDFIFLSDILILIVLVIFNFLIAYALMISKNLRQKPEGFLELFVPFIATFWILTYNIVPYLPTRLNFLVVPRSFLPLSISVGSLFALIGLIIASFAVFHLKQSFGIFVQVRDIVTKGLYRYVRHPIYLGHIMAHIGFFFITPRLYPLILSIALLSITLFRAKLEEKKLAGNSEDYRQYMKHTPFIFPYKVKRPLKN